MKLLVTGGTGYAGGFIIERALAAGYEVTCLSRSKPKWPERVVVWRKFELGESITDLPAADALIHCAFDHIKDKYRGGEGSDPDGFMRRNYDGSLALFKAAHRAKIQRIVFLSSRAVYDGIPIGTCLTEDMRLAPTSLYGQMKYQLEQALWDMKGVAATSLRATGLYGASQRGGYHKWAELFAQFEAGQAIDTRCGSEVHGDDLAAAVELCLKAPAHKVDKRVFNVSDIMLDRHDLLTAYGTLRGVNLAAPPRSESRPNEMDCAKLRALGWWARGQAGLNAFLEGLR